MLPVPKRLDKLNLVCEGHPGVQGGEGFLFLPNPPQWHPDGWLPAFKDFEFDESLVIRTSKGNSRFYGTKTVPNLHFVHLV